MLIRKFQTNWLKIPLLGEAVNFGVVTCLAEVTPFCPVVLFCFFNWVVRLLAWGCKTGNWCLPGLEPGSSEEGGL